MSLYLTPSAARANLLFDGSLHARARQQSLTGGLVGDEFRDEVRPRQPRPPRGFVKGKSDGRVGLIVFEPLGDLGEPAQRLLATRYGACRRRGTR